MAESADDTSKPLVASLIGTWLKPEMQSVYRQVTHLQRFRTVVFTETLKNTEQFPFDPLVKMKKRHFKPRGNFIWRFYWKHLRKTWPPPGYVPPEPPEDFEFFNLIPLLREHRADLLHIYYGHKAVKYLPLIKKWGGPLVVSFHGVDVARQKNRPDYFEKLPALFDYSRVVMARSESLLEELAQLGCPREKLRLNRTPIPLDDIEFTERRPPEDGAWHFTQACRLIAKKGLLTALEAMEEVVQKYPRAIYHIAGTGPMEEQLGEEITRRGLGDNVILEGWLDQARLRALFARSHLFLHPSETTSANDQEGVPNSMLEAMAAGLPIVATRHGGIPEALDSGQDGVLVPEKSPKDLAQALLKLCDNPDFLQSCSRNARATVTDRYGLPKQIERMEDCYAEAVR